MTSIVVIIASYLMGSLMFSVIMGKLVAGIDIRNHGSGNAGATNTLRIMGKGPAIIVFLLDIGKGVLAVWLAKWIVPDHYGVAVLCGIAVILGHNWPIWFNFRGGKGIATTIGMLLTLAFLPTLFAGIIAIITIVITRYVSLGSLLLTACLPVFIYGMDYPTELLWGSLAILVFAWVKHRKNIVKLVKGTENRIGSRSNRTL
ncbi:MAG: glycerol-3-phosphate 1-O-acyltransferase PlsY [Paenibacillaceae bacterium]